MVVVELAVLALLVITKVKSQSQNQLRLVAGLLD
jgi:hypothetical protein